MRVKFITLLILLCCFCALSSAPSVFANPPRTLFDSVEVRSTNFKPFRKWQAVVERYSKEGAVAGDCKQKVFTKCHFDYWEKFIAKTKNLPILEKLRAVNRFANQAKYITDPINWGQKDYWATPGEFLSHYGDCEDYAFMKYVTLMKMGVPEENLRLVAVQDLNLKVGHAILAVYVEDKIYILDNQIQQVVLDTAVRHYQPVYSLNRSAWWRHTPKIAAGG